MANVIIPPPILWKVNNILPYLDKYSDIINRFCSNNSWFLMILAKILPKISPKMQNFGQSGPKNCVFYPSPALSLHLKVFTKLRHSVFKIQKSSSFWGGTSPLRHPPVRASAQLALTRHPIIPPNVQNGSMPLGKDTETIIHDLIVILIQKIWDLPIIHCCYKLPILCFSLLTMT